MNCTPYWRSRDAASGVTPAEVEYSSRGVAADASPGEVDVAPVDDDDTPASVFLSLLMTFRYVMRNL